MVAPSLSHVSDTKPDNSGKKKHAGSFQSMGLSSEVFRGIQKMGYQQPTPVQRQALPILLTGVDAVVMARTGSGKTAAFVIPLLEKMVLERQQEQDSFSFHNKRGGVRGVILSPTRELSLQTLRVLQKMGAQTGFKFIGIHGSESMEKQFALLASQPDVIVATPGRLAHHLSEIPDFKLQSCTTLILDEADRLLEMGLAQQIRQIAKAVAPTSQKILLSATLPKVLVEFTQQHNNLNIDDNLAVIRLDQEATVSAELRIGFITCRSMEKDAALLQMLHYIKEQHKSVSKNITATTSLTLIFAATRHHVDYIAALISSSPEFSKTMEPTVIYGSLDSDARKANLAAFRSGQKPVLVVTDVAARGVDVPLIDHVIHYHFPPSPKLFVHRSGRAARAGRIGYSWALVDPEEMPYMLDLHLFLGRRPSTSLQLSQEDCDTGTDEQSVKSSRTTAVSYGLFDMTPDTVHFGSIPESVMTSQVEHVNRLSENILSLGRVCENAMKQYRKTRPMASKTAVQRAKAILDGQQTQSSITDVDIVGGGAIPIHPLFVRELQKELASESPTQNGLNSRENMKQREEFLRALAQFRPKESVFEAFATGGGKHVGVVSHVDKGRTTLDNSKKNDSSSALTAMKNMRRQMLLARDKNLVVAGSERAQPENEKAESGAVNKGDEVMDDSGEVAISSFSDNFEEKKPTSASIEGLTAPNSTDVLSVHVEGKRRLSKAERKRLKKSPAPAHGTESSNSALLSSETTPKKKKDMRSSDFRDPSFFIENDFTSNREEAHRSRQIEAAMQPSSSFGGARGKGGSLVGAAFRLEEAMLDIVGDENEELVKRQRMMRWDKSKRKYVQTTVGAELSGESRSKRMRLESGQVVKSDKLKLGELYEKWQTKTNQSIGRSGVFDDALTADGEVAGGRNKTKQKNHSGGKVGSNSKVNEGGVKTALQIKKERAKAQDNKIKNMKRPDRRSLLTKQKNGIVNSKSKAGGALPKKRR